MQNRLKSASGILMSSEFSSYCFDVSPLPYQEGGWIW